MILIAILYSDGFTAAKVGIYFGSATLPCLLLNDFKLQRTPYLSVHLESIDMIVYFSKIVTSEIFLCKKVPFCFARIVFSLIFATEKQ